MNIKFYKDGSVGLSYKGWELHEAITIYKEELAYNLWEQRDIFIEVLK